MNDERILDAELIKCKNCGGNMAFSPEKQCLFCYNCGTMIALEQNYKIVKHEFVEAEKTSVAYENWKNENKVFKCENCGANVVLNNLEFSKRCPYCSSPLVIDQNLLPSFKPDGVIPFAFNKLVANEKFRQNVKKNFFVKSKFKKDLPENKIIGFYIPSFAFDASTVSQYDCDIEKERTERDSDGKEYTQTYREHASGTIAKDFNNLVVESSSKLNQHDLSLILPYNFSYAVKYEQGFIMGYSVEHYNESFEECKRDYYNIARSNIESAIETQHSGRVVNLNLKTNFSNEKYAYDLLPVYRFEYNFNKSNYITYMNGQTGKVGGGLPLSPWKIAFVIILALLFILIPIIIGVISGMTESGDFTDFFNCLGNISKF